MLFSNALMPKYDSATSLQCANCHGLKAQGGPVPVQVNGQSVVWQAPPLNTVFLRLNEDPKCPQIDIRPTLTCAVTDVITNGRPGTPMQPWGVDGGGPKNDQSIQDLVAYLRSIQLTPKQAQALSAKNLELARTEPEDNEKAAAKQLKDDQATLATSRAAAVKALKLTDPTDAELNSACADLIKQVTADPKKVADRPAAVACGTYTTDLATVKSDQAALTWTQEWVRRRKNVQDGQLLFELNCARCHTAGWSTFDPTVPADQPGGVDSLGLPAGGGGIGGGTAFNLRDRDEIRRFGTDESGGFEAQLEFVQSGSFNHKAYGNSGIGTGRMPGFSQMLSKTVHRGDRELRALLPRNLDVPDGRAGVRDGHRTADPGHDHDEGEVGGMISHLLITAAEGPAHPNLWNPTILGVLVVLSAIGLFCGSAYLLLATNLGGRLGFLVAFASLTGFMVLLEHAVVDVG